MTLGLSLPAFTLLHVLVSLAAIGSGFVICYGLLSRSLMPRWTALYLATSVLTSATGFLFPVHQLLPSHIIGILSLLVLGAAIFARYSARLAGAWSRVYAINAVIALYFNVFVLVVQMFKHVAALTRLAPTQSEPPFAIVQGLVLLSFIALGIAAGRGFGRIASPAV